MIYKVVCDRMLIDLIKDPVWVIWAAGRFVQTDKNTANGIVASDGNEVFHLAGTPEFSGYPDEYKTVTVTEISIDGLR